MTNEQLCLLLTSMLAELDTVIDATREALPEGAEREVLHDWRTKEQFIGTVKATFDLTGETREKYTYQGEYLALLPLIALRAGWQARANLLSNGVTE